MKINNQIPIFAEGRNYTYGNGKPEITAQKQLRYFN